MTASGNITAGSLSSLGASTNPGGNITLISTNGAINTRSNSTSSLGFVRTLGGTIRLSALGDITTDSLATAATSGPSAGGPITLTSTAGAIDTRRTVTSTSTSTTSTSTSTSTTSTTQNAAITSGGGAITLTAAGNITAGEINASANTAVNGTATNGGNVKITTPGDLLVSQINTQSRAASLGTGTGGTGGTVTIEVGNFVRVSDRFTDQNNISASISSAGGAGGGAISITHGGRGVTPFIVGDAGVNGTAGAITTGTSTILPTQSFLQSTIIGNISILTSTSILASPLPTPPSFGCDLTLCQSPIATAPMPLNVSVPTPQDTLQQIEEATGVVPALIYLSFIPTEVAIVDAWQANESRLTSEISRFVGKPNDRSLLAITTPDSEFELLLVTATGDPIRKRIPGLTRTKMIQVAQQFRNEVANPVKVRTRSYLPTAQRLYDWIIRPLEQELVARKIQNLSFIAETGLRFIPFAALHDGENFLIDKYSLGLMPSLSLVDTRYVNIRNSQVLVGGTSTFTDLPPLPAVPTEMAAISQLWPNGTKVLNDDQFTLKELKAARQQQPFGIIHLATHGEFIANHLGESYIQLSDTRLRLDQLRLLGFNHPPVELMVLSACRMALGDDDAELGFAGLALQAGVKSALASLWNVSDEGTVALMTAFYGGLRQAPIKAEALRQAQLAMRNGQVSIRDGKVVYTDSTGELTFDLPESLRTVDNRNLLHPYYWAAFTMLGSPW